MPSIKILSSEVSELIAAGEVIERPASVIKELVENSIDAGAEHITVEIKNGGTTYMRVTDDGCGMSFEDVPKAFLRHATSKINTKEDLDNICTLGFRGEALASVSAVSKIELMTKQKSQKSGTAYGLSGGKEIRHEKSNCPDGTTIVIRDLFYNVPARRKFMKKDVTEANAVSQIIQKQALSHPEIAFKFIRNNRIELNSSGDGELYSAIYAVYGRDFAHDMMSVDYQNEGIHLTGYIIKPLYAKSNRSFQNFFVNGRHVHSKICSASLESGYENMVMTGKFPACVLMIEIDPAVIDVNIHPSKAEVRFADEKKVSDTIFFAVKNTMVKDGLLYEFDLDSVKTETDFPQEEENQKTETEQDFQPIFTPVEKISETEQIKKTENDIFQDFPEFVYDEREVSESQSVTDNSSQKEQQEMLEGFSYISKSIFEDSEFPEKETFKTVQQETVKTERPEINAIGEVFGLYVIAETTDRKMVIIDKHAAHERIIFERLKSRNCRQYMQMLMTDIKILLTAEEVSAMQENTELLADMGFMFDFSESPCVITKAVPTFISSIDIESVISEVAENLCLHVQNPQSHMLDDMLHTVACRSAIKANDKTSLKELQSLAEQVYYDDRIRHCPHGRPVMFTMTESNIAHQFRRT
ncbi:MAG: DNA mismatch repair endonuclease MutL [Ruminococcus sp.]|nr:DNA mismatch repair endonuclease MutL [Ruminococcus sp.]